MKVAANPFNPAYQCMFENGYTEIFEGKPNVILTFGVHVRALLTAISKNEQSLKYMIQLQSLDDDTLTGVTSICRKTYEYVINKEE